MNWALRAAIVILPLAAIVVSLGATLLGSPMLAQTDGHLDLGYRLERSAPWITIGLFAVGALLVALQWRRAEWWLTRGLFALSLVVLGAGVWMSRVNWVERMFHPLEAGDYYDAVEAQAELADEDVVLGLKVDGQAVAYPVRLIAYHHIVNERLKVEPFVVTF